MVTRDKEDHIMTKRSTYQEDITVVNIQSPNIGAKYINKILTDLKGEIDDNTIIVKDFSIPLLTKDRSSRQKINKETLDLNHTLDQIS